MNRAALLQTSSLGAKPVLELSANYYDKPKTGLISADEIKQWAHKVEHYEPNLTLEQLEALRKSSGFRL